MFVPGLQLEHMNTCAFIHDRFGASSTFMGLQCAFVRGFQQILARRDAYSSLCSCTCLQLIASAVESLA